MLNFVQNCALIITLDWFKDTKLHILCQKIILYSSKGGLATTATTS